MSIVVNEAGATPAPSTPPRGFTPDEIIEMATKRTERRGKTLDLKSEFIIVCQELAAERRWHWRKKSVTFATEAGTALYDLTEIDAMNGLTCERVCREGPKLILSGSNKVSLSAIFETDLQEDARDDTTQEQPGQYFIDGQDQVRLVAIPNAVYTVRIPMWVLPALGPGDLAETVPLVPAYLHHILIKALEARIFRFTIGEGAPKYMAAKAEYEAAVAKAAISTDFADGRIKEWKSDQEAIRST